MIRRFSHFILYRFDESDYLTRKKASLISIVKNSEEAVTLINRESGELIDGTGDIMPGAA